MNESGRRASLKAFEDEILERIPRVQSSFPELILASINVQEEYGLSKRFKFGGFES